MTDQPIAKTPLHALHVSLGARMVPFSGYDMPVQYPAGIVAEHLHTRAMAGLFDVSHMGQAILSGHDAGRRLETLVPGDLQALGEGRMRYTQLLDRQGNILDDLMVTRLAGQPGGHETLFLVVNAGTKIADFALIEQHLPELSLRVLADHGLIALQGPKAATVLARHFPGIEHMPFPSMKVLTYKHAPLYLSRCGYTGEDGFEISLHESELEAFARMLLAEPEVLPIGLGARDSLRLEAGLCLYGHDIDTATTPVEAGLAWSISKRRQANGGFPGDERVRRQLAHGPDRMRVGILPDGKAPAREGTAITTPEGTMIGRVTSGGFGPTLGGPLAMGYVEAAHSAPGTRVNVIVRGKPLPGGIVKMPFVPARFYRGKATS